jgi:hypothetical protein
MRLKGYGNAINPWVAKAFIEAFCDTCRDDDRGSNDQMSSIRTTRAVWDRILVDPHGNHNNHDSLLIYRAVYRASAQLLALESDTLVRINEVTKEMRQTLVRHP